jgi:hypothetical protein
MGVVIEEITAFGWEHCLRLSNGAWDLVVSTDVGPRVLRCGPLGGANLLKVFPRELGRLGGPRWRIYGGHRFWVSPERRPYPPDNRPVAWRRLAGGVRLLQPREPRVPWRKVLDLRLHPRRGEVRATHRLINAGRRPLRVAAWALTVFPGGGVAFLPLPERASFPSRVQPSGPLVLWPYTDLADRRWRFGKRHLFLRVPAGPAAAQKLGAHVPGGWVSYQRSGIRFTIRFQASPRQAATDYGSHVELFTQNGMVELETLGETKLLQAGAELVHEERWLMEAARALPKT